MHWGAELSDRNVSIAPLGPPNLWFARAAARAPRFPGVLTGNAVALDRDDARLRAFAELVEHVAAFVSGTEAERLRRASATELWAAGEVAISPVHLALAPRTTPRVDPVDDDTPITWARGVDLASGRPTWAPALVSHLSWAPPPGEPLFARPSATGLAAHRDADSCARHALFEVLERDACGLSWRVPGWPVRAIDPGVVDARLREACADLELELFEVGDPELPASCVIALVHTGEGAQLSVGSACRATASAAAAGAVIEALMVRWTLARFGNVAPALLPTTSLEHVVRAYHCGAEIMHWYRRQACNAEPATTGELVHRAAAVLASPIVAVDVCDRKGRDSGWHVARVVVPGAYPRESDGRLVKTDGHRLDRALARYARGVSLHRAPHPFG